MSERIYLATANAEGEVELPTSVVNSSSASNGLVPVANGSGGYTWEAPSGGGAVSSVFGRTGVVVAKSGDYTAAQVGADVSGAAITAQANAEAAVNLAKLAAIQPFPVELPVGALGNGKLLTDAAITISTKFLKSASNPFHEADVGKYMAICSAGAEALEEGKKNVGTGNKAKQFNTLCSRIAKYISAGEVELETEAKNTVTGALAVFATDDTAAIQTAINKAVERAQTTGIGYCEVWFSAAIYGVAGELKTGGTTEGNAQITLPVIASTSAGTASQGQKITINLKGSAESSALPQWFQKVPQQTGSLLFSFGPREASSTKLVSPHAQPAYSAANGRPSMIGGPTPEKGFTLLEFSNMMCVVTGLTISAPSNGTMSGIDLSGVSNANIVSLGSYALGIPSVEAAGEYTGGINEFVKPWAGYEGEFEVHKRPACALMMPGRGNNDNSYLTQHSVEGHTCALEAGEHGWHGAMRSIYCLMALIPTTQGYEHVSTIGYMSVEACAFGIYGSASGESTLQILKYDSENASGRWGKLWDIYDPENKVAGECNMFLVAPPPKISGARKMKVTCNLGSSPSFWYAGRLVANGFALPVIPASGAIMFNTYWRDAWVTIKAAKSVCKVTVDGSTEFTGNPVTGKPEVTAVALPIPNTACNSLAPGLVKGAILKGTDVEGIEVESYNAGTKVLTLKTNATGSGTKLAINSVAPPQNEIPSEATQLVFVPAGHTISLSYTEAPTWDWSLA